MASNAANFREFEIELEREQEDIFKGRIVEVTQMLGMQGLRRVVFKSPVGNPDLWQPQSLPPPSGYTGGTFRSNWMVDLGAADERTQEAIEDPGSVIARGAATIQGAPAFRQIVIHNSLPYAERIEEGHSTQAPAGVVDVTVAELQSQFRRIE